MFFDPEHVAQVRWKFYKGRVVWYCVVFDWPRTDYIANTTVYSMKAIAFDVSKDQPIVSGASLIFEDVQVKGGIFRAVREKITR
jgi:hypothetical protein